MKLKFYCPACGEQSEIEEIEDFEIFPDVLLDLLCPSCKTKWRICTQYECIGYEVDNEN